MARKLFSELGAIMEDVTNYINEVVVKELGISPEYIEQEKTLQLEEIRGRVSLYHDDT
jgi:predicted phosphoribosyltransferase